MRLLICDINRHDRARRNLEDACDVIIGREELSAASGCTGCFECWVRTPGRCVIEDSLKGMARLLAAADELWVAAENTFGGYSSLVKRALDRSIPYLHPCFRVVHGEMHHRMRYARGSAGGSRLRQRIWLYGASSAEERARFARLARAMSVDLDLDLDLDDILFPPAAEQVGLEDAFERCARGPGGSRGRPADSKAAPARAGVSHIGTAPQLIGCVCASPSGKRSATWALLDDFEEALLAYERVSAHKSSEPAAEAPRLARFSIDASGDLRACDEEPSEAAHEDPLTQLATCDTIVLGHPVYVDTLPSSLITVLERLDRAGAPAAPTRLYAISNLGFYEPQQGRCAAEALAGFCLAHGIAWGGALIAGGGGMIVAMRSAPRLGALRRRISEGIDRLILAVRSGVAVPDIEIRCALPRFAYIRATERRWRALAKSNGCDLDDATR